MSHVHDRSIKLLPYVSLVFKVLTKPTTCLPVAVDVMQFDDCTRTSYPFVNLYKSPTTDKNGYEGMSEVLTHKGNCLNWRCERQLQTDKAGAIINSTKSKDFCWAAAHTYTMGPARLPEANWRTIGTSTESNSSTVPSHTTKPSCKKMSRSTARLMVECW